ncbi:MULTISPECIES: pyridoxal phosphate-dependent aminotransferase [Kitasatospora]|uniref:alanine transaminase n=1 Tax=Kitasatospora setae (strain ATCC 33774 / DSM 43861 / JCM 3304 / KCC A-0304 / NBRC 14216 / KM-6054) TaxID=452652 RepID=E4N6B7_KITSK|nr:MULTISPECIES: pyridoxal phosphate-dependent aminotransferase [Kitasatospora]BAJ26748.1 putative aminotransferase [Kitasatospora setae KM-6054]
MVFIRSSRFAEVRYEIRGPLSEEARVLEEAGRTVLRLNTGDPAAFGFRPPPAFLAEVLLRARHSNGYSDARGLLESRQAVAEWYRAQGVADVGAGDVVLGNGTSELIAMALQALLEPGDEVLVPSPDYPAWTANTSFASGRPVHYRCDESAGWLPDLDDLAARVTSRTRAVVLINPNNPTGAVYPGETVEGVLEIARRHGLMVLSDEVYDRILYDGAVHQRPAALGPDVVCLTFGSLSKSYRVAGFRAGWVVLSGHRSSARDYFEGLLALASLRVCANTLGQCAVEVALADPESRGTLNLALPGARLHQQREQAWKRLTAIPGVSCVKPMGAVYAFARLDPEVYKIHDDGRLALDLLRSKRVQIVQGTGFNWPAPDHFRMLTLPRVEVIDTAVNRIERFLADYVQ